MPTALIGHGGFIGANLAAQAHFDEKVDARGVESIRGKSFRLLVCAPDPAADREELQRLAASLREVKAEKLLLVSTVDVYPRPEAVDEDSPIDLSATATPRGRHLRELELSCAEHFSATVLRLPLLFGPGLERNLLLDLLSDREVENIHPDGVFQYYAVAHLWRDANIALERGLPLLNLAAEPIPTRELALRCFGRELTAYPASAPAVSDVRSKHAPLWGGERYLYSKERVLQEIADFVEKERAL